MHLRIFTLLYVLSYYIFTSVALKNSNTDNRFIYTINLQRNDIKRSKFKSKNKKNFTQFEVKFVKSVRSK